MELDQQFWKEADPYNVMSESARQRIQVAVNATAARIKAQKQVEQLQALAEANATAEFPSLRRDPTRWVYFDYLDGKLGMRVEPEDQARADAIKASIPKAERIYIGSRRTWVVKPAWAATLMAILEEHCPGYQVLLQGENRALLAQIIYGPRATYINHSHEPAILWGHIGERTLPEMRTESPRPTSAALKGPKFQGILFNDDDPDRWGST